MTKPVAKTLLTDTGVHTGSIPPHYATSLLEAIHGAQVPYGVPDN